MLSSVGKHVTRQTAREWFNGHEWQRVEFSDMLNLKTALNFAQSSAWLSKSTNGAQCGSSVTTPALGVMVTGDWQSFLSGNFGFYTWAFLLFSFPRNKYKYAGFYELFELEIIILRKTPRPKRYSKRAAQSVILSKFLNCAQCTHVLNVYNNKGDLL